MCALHSAFVVKIVPLTKRLTDHISEMQNFVNKLNWIVGMLSLMSILDIVRVLLLL